MGTVQEITFAFHQYILQTLHTGRLVPVLKHQLLHHQLKQSIFPRTISPLIPTIFVCVSGYMYFILQLGTGLFR
jgi:hypothetical protein